MRRLAAVALVLVTVFALMMGVAMRVGASQALPVRVERQHLADCDLPCWNGLTPGVSLPSEAKVRIDAAFPDFERSANAVSSQFLIWTEYSDIDRVVRVVNVIFQDERVTAIGIGTDHTSEDMPRLGEILAVFGAPTCITWDNVSNHSHWFYENSEHHFMLQFSTLLTLASPVNNLYFGDADNSSCQAVGALSWRAFRALRPSFLLAS